MKKKKKRRFYILLILIHSRHTKLDQKFECRYYKQYLLKEMRKWLYARVDETFSLPFIEERNHA